jgi:phosphoribosylaminoimidazolecarboxamide formyltransferase/IMP cyclohydrolase
MADARPPAEPVTAPGDVRVARALLSVSDKTGIVAFARGLAELGIELVSTGGTARALQDAGIDVRAVEDFTGFPEILDGRVKTLHPRLYAGLLAVRSDPAHLQAVAEHGIEWVDLVCVNLYPFEATAARRDVTDAELIEQVDIGGPTMIRAAAKNHAFAAVVVEPGAYDAVLEELRDTGGTLSMPTREALAAAAFSATARYDTAISRWFAERSEDFPDLHVRAFEKVMDLSYGENPHQRAAFYRQIGTRTHLLSMVEQHHGKAAVLQQPAGPGGRATLVAGFDEPACAIVKHNNPCGVARGATLRRPTAGRSPATRSARSAASSRATGRWTRPPRCACTSSSSRSCSPRATPPRRSRSSAQAEHPILEDRERRHGAHGSPRSARSRRPARAGPRLHPTTARPWRSRPPRPPRRSGTDLLFAWQVARSVKSNAIVLARAERRRRRGGADEPGDSVRWRSRSPGGPSLRRRPGVGRVLPVRRRAAARDRGGDRRRDPARRSVRDDEVVAAADAAGIAMV